MFRFGVVVATDSSKAKVRVKFSDLDGMISWWLPVLQSKTLRDKEYWMPDINEHVACLLDDKAEAGVVFGAFYSDADKVPVSSQDKWHKTFEDGTILEYDRSKHLLTINVKGDVEVNVTGGVNSTINGNLTCQVDQNADISVSGNATVQAGGCQANLAGGTMAFVGDINVAGSINATGSIIDSGGNTSNHDHSD